MPSTLGDFKMVWMHKNKLLTGIFLAVCLLAMAAATAVQAQSMSARGIDMSALKNQQANPCKGKTMIHMPIHPYADSDGCVGVVTKTQSGNDFNINVSAAFKDETTFEGESVFENGAKIGNAGSCNSSADAGTLRYNTSKSKIEFCDGSSFRDLDGPRGARGPGGPRGPGGEDGETTTVGSGSEPTEPRSCNEGACQNIGEYQLGSYGACSARCNGGTKTAEYFCPSEFDDCVGPKPAEKSQECNTQPGHPDTGELCWETDIWEKSGYIRPWDDTDIACSRTCANLRSIAITNIRQATGDCLCYQTDKTHVRAELPTRQRAQIRCDGSCQ